MNRHQRRAAAATTTDTEECFIERDAMEEEILAWLMLKVQIRERGASLERYEAEQFLNGATPKVIKRGRELYARALEMQIEEDGDPTRRREEVRVRAVLAMIRKLRADRERLLKNSRPGVTSAGPRKE
jgi:hypothetical protein